MAKVLGLGGVFFTSPDPAALRAWYARVLGIAFADWGGVVFRPEAAVAQPGAAAVLAVFDRTSDHFAPSAAPFMLNLMVDDLPGMLARCAAHGVMPISHLPAEANGGFAQILDPEGRKIELWEPQPMT